MGIGAATGIVAGLVGGFIGGLGVFGLGLKGAILGGAIGGYYAGLASEFTRQLLSEGKMTDPHAVLTLGIFGIITGGVFGAIGYRLSGSNTFWRVLRNRDITDSQITANAFRPDKYGELSVFRGPKWIIKPLVRMSRLFSDVGGLAQISRESVESAGMSIVPRYDPNLGPILGRLHENIIYSSGAMTKAEFGRKILSLMITWSR